MVRRVVILADDSASWKIAGLRQLERIALAAKEEAAFRAEGVQFFISWSPGASQFLPQHPRLSPLDFTKGKPEEADLVLSTHTFLARHRTPIGLQEDSEELANPAQIAGCEKRFLQRSGKPQDGFVSRFVNRPISRALSRLLLRTSITPSGWTLAIFVLPVIGSGFLLRGDYVDVIVGLLFFQLYSVLDGCDGEIARAKYLDSERGQKLDTWCDVVGSLLLALSLGFGLSRLAEGIVVATLIATNELLLALPSRTTPAPPTQDESALYPRHRRILSGTGFRIPSWMLQLTKRDVGLVLFLLLAIVGRPAWILHLSGAVAAISGLLASRSLRRR
ncbi:MAG: CDP-alcohol phosphatidyltransferase family protein [Chthoniobacterales bacterium]